MPLFRAIVLVSVLVLAGCGTDSPEPGLGVAFVGPMRLDLWAELAPRAAVTATLKQGQRVEILETRRRFVRVRTEGGTQGWTEAEFLLNQAQVEAYRASQESLEDLPSMGVATVSNALNTHIAPHRVAPSFTQIPESGRVEIIGHCVAPRGAYLPPPRRAWRGGRGGKEDSGGAQWSVIANDPSPRPPPPKAPALPENWLRLSRPRLSDVEGITTAEQREQENEAASVPSDDWYLVRTPEGRVGWALARRLVMAVPDEVAQYAEGQRITSYFAVGEVTDGGKKHRDWLWTTLGAYDVPYQFDSVRYFTWSRRRHRYETTYIERRLHGYYPVRLLKTKAGDIEGFSLIERAADGELQKRAYRFLGNRVRLTGREAYTKPVNNYQRYLIPDVAPEAASKKAASGFFGRLWTKVSSLFHRR